MARSSRNDTIERLRKIHAAAVQKASAALEDVVLAAGSAATGEDGMTRKLFRKHEARARKASDKWRRTADDLAKHLRKKKKG